MNFLNKYSEVLHRDGYELWFKAIILGFLNFMTFVVAGLAYFIPIDLTWRIIGKLPAILLGSLSLFIYAVLFAVFMIVSMEKMK